MVITPDSVFPGPGDFIGGIYEDVDLISAFYILVYLWNGWLNLCWDGYRWAVRQIHTRRRCPGRLHPWPDRRAGAEGNAYNAQMGARMAQRPTVFAKFE